MRVLTTIVCVLAFATPAQAHLVRHFKKNGNTYATAAKNLKHVEYVCARGKGKVKREHCRAIPWLRSLATPPATSLATAPQSSWVERQISAAEAIARSSGGDPWPNCPDPYDGGGSWQATVNCENGGSWYDSPGYYRCGLQFDPMWERRFGRLCP